MRDPVHPLTNLYVSRLIRGKTQEILARESNVPRWKISLAERAKFSLEPEEEENVRKVLGIAKGVELNAKVQLPFLN
jgi:hypothetical protein